MVCVFTGVCESESVREEERGSECSCVCVCVCVLCQGPWCGSGQEDDGSWFVYSQVCVCV